MVCPTRRPRIRLSPPSLRCRLGDHHFPARVLAGCLPARRAAVQVRSGKQVPVVHRCMGQAGAALRVRAGEHAGGAPAGLNLADFGTAHA
eukprot:9537288-Alexandrium_andersonii.AAC.1